MLPLGAKARSAKGALMSAKILIVDDDEALRMIAVKLVERRGYATRTAAGGHEALEILKSGAQFDMLILDVVSPLYGSITAVGGDPVVVRVRVVPAAADSASDLP